MCAVHVLNDINIHVKKKEKKYSSTAAAVRLSPRREYCPCDPYRSSLLPLRKETIFLANYPTANRRRPSGRYYDNVVLILVI